MPSINSGVHDNNNGFGLLIYSFIFRTRTRPSTLTILNLTPTSAILTHLARHSPRPPPAQTPLAPPRPPASSLRQSLPQLAAPRQPRLPLRQARGAARCRRPDRVCSLFFFCFSAVWLPFSFSVPFPCG
ncbi:hypothetical protein N658DRAFT_85948 [Parathielavia hyrcaniae]|uniref:Uncharacterized protein n=1 Tax=Parathielavia hyrcaniae TaxID=113614 RepID=A0AAN6T125_9PEZI|nr:hypothetical protein N658DRAFT_85948 [Parathielavia hyrcaniae]